MKSDAPKVPNQTSSKRDGEMNPQKISTREVLIQQAVLKIQHIFHDELCRTGGCCITTLTTDKIWAHMSIMTIPVHFYFTAGILAIATGYPFPCSSFLSAYHCCFSRHKYVQCRVKASSKTYCTLDDPWAIMSTSNSFWAWRNKISFAVDSP